MLFTCNMVVKMCARSCSEMAQVTFAGSSIVLHYRNVLCNSLANCCFVLHCIVEEVELYGVKMTI